MSYRLCFEVPDYKRADLRINIWYKLTILKVKKSECYGVIALQYTNWVIICCMI